MVMSLAGTPPAAPASTGASSRSAYLSTPNEIDPYVYQTGFGNRFASEAIPGTLPQGRNTPQKVKYDLYSEQLNGTSFISSRETVQHVWFYRIFPSVAHGPIVRPPVNRDVESSFLSNNDNVEFVPFDLCWLPFKITPPTEGRVDFVQGIKTILGQGDSTTKEGVAVHIYTANTSMTNRALVNGDGDMLIIPQTGRLDIQTELGKMMVRPGEMAVIQAGIRFRVALPDGNARGYIQEVFGCHYELPELGPIGTNGLALPRDFEYPVASFDMDRTEWEIVHKLAGKFWSYKQKHTPFDVVAWHGNYVPYKYATEKFINVSVVDRDQSDPTVYCLLTAKSKIPGVSISEVCIFTPRWSVTTNSFRPPYYHRNMATEVMGIIYGPYGGSSRDLQAGGLSYQSSYMPHGETHEVFMKATNAELVPERIGEGFLAFCLHISTHCAITKYALDRSGVLDAPPADIWDSMVGHFYEHIDDANADLEKLGLAPLGSSSY